MQVLTSSGRACPSHFIKSVPPMPPPTCGWRACVAASVASTTGVNHGPRSSARSAARENIRTDPSSLNDSTRRLPPPTRNTSDLPVSCGRSRDTSSLIAGSARACRRSTTRSWRDFWRIPHGDRRVSARRLCDACTKGRSDTAPAPAPDANRPRASIPARHGHVWCAAPTAASGRFRQQPGAATNRPFWPARCAAAESVSSRRAAVAGSVQRHAQRLNPPV